MSKTTPIGDHATEFLDDAAAMQLEDTVWWHVGRRAILETYLDVAARKRPLRRILEIGCGSGGHLELLAGYGDVIAVERSEVLARRARSRGIARTVLAGDARQVAPEGPFDMVCLFDVLEHIREDGEFLTSVGELMAPGDLFLLSVPACQALFSPHDAALHHHRRYSRRGLIRLLESHGYEVVKQSYFLFFLFPIIAAARLVEKLQARLGRPPTEVKLGVVNHRLNALLIRVLKLEAIVSRRMSLPFGIWLIVLARKR